MQKGLANTLLYSEPMMIQREALERLASMQDRDFSKLDITASQQQYNDKGIEFAQPCQQVELSALRRGSAPVRFNEETGIAVVEIIGLLWPRLDFWTWLFFGGVGLDELQFKLAILRDSPEVNAVVLRIDSPGGAVGGVESTAEIVFSMRERMRVVALADDMAASAGFFIASAAHEVLLASRMATVGSIGTLLMHRDVSNANIQRGQIVTIIKAGKFKGAGTSQAPLTEETRGVIQERVNSLNVVFVDSVARFLGKTVEDVQENMADGRVFSGEDAIQRGLATGVMSFVDLISKLTEEILTMDGNTPNQGTGTAPDQQPAAPAQSDAPQPKPVQENAPASQTPQITADTLAASHPQVYQTIFDRGVKQGADNERERQNEIDAVAEAGYEKLVADAKADPAQNAGTLAIAIQKERKAKQQNGPSHSDLQQTAPPAVAQGDSGDGELTEAQVIGMIAGVSPQTPAGGA